jgi:pantoate--beta-alanine ligase
MGALHGGHMSLIEAARRECDFVVVSVFVNPTQFGPHEDYSAYPRDFERDLAECRKAGVDVVFHPPVEEIYPPGFTTVVDVERLSGIFEGQFRPGHFRGVATVVLKLFLAVPAEVAYFGQKDYQQQAIIHRMCRELNVPIEVRVCPTIREADGLALSSRNVYLSPAERHSALALSKSLELARQRVASGVTDFEVIRQEMRALLEATPRVAVDYVALVDPESLAELNRPAAMQVALVAARVGSTRLIDNLLIEAPPRAR